MKKIFLLLIACIIINIVYATELEDKSGHLLNITNSGCDYNSAGYFTCWDSDYLRAPTGALRNGTSNTPFTIQIRFRFNLTSGIMSDSNAGYLFADNTSTSNLFCRMYYFSSVRYRTCTIGGVAMSNYGNNASNLPNTWLDFILTYNSTAACLYFNNTLDGCVNTNFTGINYSNSYLKFSNNGALTRGGDIDIDFIQTWNRALSSTDVSALFSNTTGVQANYRLSYFDFTNNTCTILSVMNKNNFASSVSLCEQVYVFNSSYDAILINTSSNMFLNCSNAAIIQLAPRNSSKAIEIATGVTSADLNNITIKNCNITGWGNGIYLTDFSGGSMSQNTSIYNNIISESGDLAAIYVESSNKFFIYNNTLKDNAFYGLRAIGTHGIYVSGGASRCPNSGEIYNNNIYNVTTGIKVNAACQTKNFRIYNNMIYNLHPPSSYDWDDIGVHLAWVENVSVYNNSIFNLTFSTTKTSIYLNINSSGVDSSAPKDTKIYNNSFYNVETGIFFTNGTSNSEVYNNNYSNSNYNWRMDGYANFSLYNESLINISTKAALFRFRFINISMSNIKITLY